jgi:molecular chaperone HscB
LETKLNLDLDALQKRFYELSKALHPDRYLRKSEIERGYSLEASAVLNDGYRTLRDPVLRAEYVLKAHGFDIGEQRSKDVPPELLEEVFELNLALEELKSGDNCAKPQLEEAQRKFEHLQAETDRDLIEQFRRWDSGAGKEALMEIRKILNRRRYVSNLLREAGKALASAA